MKKIYSKIIAVFMLLITLFSSFSNIAFATDISSANLKVIENSDSHIQFKFDSGWGNVRTNYIGYTVNGKTYASYCISHGYPGVDEVGNYTVSINSLLSDERLWRTITMGFPYSSASSLGVECDLDAYVATKQAVYCVILGRDVYSLYRGRDARGNKIVDAIYRLTQEGLYGTRRRVDPAIFVNKVGGFKRDNINSNYYMQEYSLTSNLEMSTYTITDVLGFPSGTLITDMNNNQKNTFNAGNNFKVLVPISALGQEINGTIVANGKVKSYPVFFGATPNSSWQNYAITYDPYSVTGGRASFKAQVVGTPTLTKVERGNEAEKLKGAVYNIYKDNNNNGIYDNGDTLALTTNATDSNGQVSFQLPIANYVAVEKTAPVGYNLDPEHIPFSVNVDNLNVTITARDTVITGNVAITKTDRDTGEKLSGADYNIYKDNNNNKKYDSSDTFITTTGKTDENGLVSVSDLRYGNYVAVEKTAPAHYNLDTSSLPFSILNQGETVQISSTDLIFKGDLELTKVERGNEELKLSGAVYDIYADSNNNKRFDEGEVLVVTSDATGNDGKVVVPKLRYGNYVAVEKIAPVGYNLDPDHIPFSVEYEGQIITVTARDTVITGGINITKTDREDTTKRLKGAVYNIYADSNNNKRFDEGETLITTTGETDDNGLVSVPNLRYGNYVAVEKIAPEFYELDPEHIPFSITEQGQIINIIAKDTASKGNIKIVKTSEDGKNIEGIQFKIKGTSFLGEKYEEIITTDKDGVAVLENIKIGDNFTAEELNVPEGYVKPENQTFNIEANKTTELSFYNAIIRGKITLEKKSSEDNELTGLKKGSPLAGAEYTIYDENMNVLQVVTTGEDGKVTTDYIKYGKVYIKETKSPYYYLIDDAVYEMFIKRNEEIEFFEHTDNSVKIKVDVYKQGIKQTFCGQEIRYDFCNIENKSNVPLNNFYWEDNLPKEVRITSLFTGTFNQDLEYTISYKTNKTEYKELETKYSTQKNNYIDFKAITLAEDEYITDYKLNFGTTDPGFKEVEKPFILVNVLDGLNVDTIFTNYTTVGGSYLEKEVKEQSKWSTCLYEKQIKVKETLPRTGY